MEEIALTVESLQVVRVGESVFDDETCNHPPSFLGMYHNLAESSLLLFQELETEEPCADGKESFLYHFRVLVRRGVDHRARSFTQSFGEMLVHTLLPVVVEGAITLRHDWLLHFQTVGLDAVHWSHHTV